MYWHDRGWGPGAWIAMALIMVVFWGSVVALIVYAVRASHHPAPSAIPPANDAERILDERFARGEIDADEYQHRRELLRSK